MGKLQEVNKKIDGKLKEIERDKDRAEAARKMVNRNDAAIGEIRGELKQVRRFLDNRRKVLAEVKDDIDEIRKEGVTEEEEQELERLQQRLEILADKIEEGRALKERLLDRLDTRQENREEAQKALREEIKERKEDHDDLQRLRKRREQIRENQKDRIGKYWHIREFDCREGGPTPTHMEDDLERHARLFLDPMREKFGAGHCNSGHRWTWYNAKIGGADGSYHCYEVRQAFPATDLTFARGTPAEWASYARQLADRHGFGGIGQYSSFVHIDPRPYRSNWYG